MFSQKLVKKHFTDKSTYSQQEAQLSLGQLTLLVVSNLQGHPRSMIFISSEKMYATSY